MPAPYPEEFRRRAVELARSGDRPVTEVAAELGISVSGLRRWLTQSDVDSGRRAGVTSDERAELSRLRKENRVLRMERELLSSRSLLRLGECPAEVIYRFMEANKADFAIRFMAQRLGVSTSGFYGGGTARPIPRRAVADAWLTGLITRIWQQSRGTYGSPRVWAELRIGQDIRVGRKRVERLMRRAGLQGAYRPRRRTRNRSAGVQVSDDLVNRRFHPDGPDRLWVADITEHPTAEGKVFLAAVVDAWSRRVVGWSIADHLRAELVIDALDMALWRRRPPAGLVHHSDHGTQYTSWAFGQRLRSAGILGSMGTIGDALDNAMVESFFGTIQIELLDRRRWTTRRQLAQAIFEYIEAWYNPRRRHSALDYHSPINYEHRHTPQEAVA